MRAAAGRLARLLEGLGAACLVILMVTVFVDVLGRNLFGKPLPWGTEVLEIVLAALIFLLYPVLALRFGHITVDLIAVRPAVQRVQRALGALLGCALFVLVAGCLVRQTLRAADYGERTALLGVPIAWVLGGMALLAGVTALAFVVAAARRADRGAVHLVAAGERAEADRAATDPAVADRAAPDQATAARSAAGPATAAPPPADRLSGGRA